MIIGGQSGSLLRRRFTSPHSSRNASGTEWSLPSTLYCFNISAASSILRCWVVIPSIKNNLFFFTKTSVCVVWERLGCNVGMFGNRWHRRPFGRDLGLSSARNVTQTLQLWCKKHRETQSSVNYSALAASGVGLFVKVKNDVCRMCKQDDPSHVPIKRQWSAVPWTKNKVLC